MREVAAAFGIKKSIWHHRQATPAAAYARILTAADTVRPGGDKGQEKRVTHRGGQARPAVRDAGLHHIGKHQDPGGVQGRYHGKLAISADETSEVAGTSGF